MDSLTAFDEDEDFFGSYDAEEGGMSLAPLGFDDADAQPPTPEQLAHLSRFRKPVAGIVASMTLLSIVALGVHGSRQRGSGQELVAHYGAAIAAPTLGATSTLRQPASVPEAPAALAPKAPATLVPEAWAGLLAEVWSALVPDASAAANPAAPALAESALAEAAPALEPAPSNPTGSELSPPLDASPVRAFLAPPTAICLLPAASPAALDPEANTAAARAAAAQPAQFSRSLSRR